MENSFGPIMQIRNNSVWPLFCGTVDNVLQLQNIVHARIESPQLSKLEIMYKTLFTFNKNSHLNTVLNITKIEQIIYTV